MTCYLKQPVLLHWLLQIVLLQPDLAMENIFSFAHGKMQPFTPLYFVAL